MKIKNLFNIENSYSKGFKKHKRGNVPFISNGFKNNGVVGFVEPLLNEKIFGIYGICISAFCEATVQKPPYLPRGNGGSGLIVLSPKEKMSLDELYWYASCINKQSWRYSFGRMVIADRIKNLTITIPVKNFLLPISLDELLKIKHISFTVDSSKPFKIFTFDTFFDVVKGKGKYFSNCKHGDTPLISASKENNGIIGYVNLEPTFKAPAITVDRVAGNSFVQLNEFATVPDDIFVLIPKEKYPIEFFFVIASLFKQRVWRFSYSRKLTQKRIKKLEISLPIDSKNNVDFQYIYKLVNSLYSINQLT